MCNHHSEEYRRYRSAVQDLRLQQQQRHELQQIKSEDKYDPMKTFEEETNQGGGVLVNTSQVATIVAEVEQPKPEKMVYASIDKSDSSDSDTEYMREAKKRNLKNLKNKARFPDFVSQVRKRNADSTDSEDDTDNSRSLCDSHSEGHAASNQSINNTTTTTQQQQQQERGVKRELENSESSSSTQKQRTRKSRWGDKVQTASSPIVVPPTTQQILPTTGQTVTLTAVRRNDPALLKYAIENYGSVNLSEEDWKKAEEHYKINLLYQDMVRKRQEIDRLAKAGKFKYEYDSDEDVQGGTWEHKLRVQEMEATRLWADALTKQAEGKHHIGNLEINCLVN